MVYLAINQKVKASGLINTIAKSLLISGSTPDNSINMQIKQQGE